MPICEICHGDGMYLRYHPETRTSEATFCKCAEGQRRRSAWILAGEIGREEARKDQARRMRKATQSGVSRIRDHKAEAAGKDDDDVPL
jgi:hypothetical protein